MSETPPRTSDSLSLSPREALILGALLAIVGIVLAVRASLQYESAEVIQPSPAVYLIPVNSAPAAELECLPHIGPSSAKRIVEYRRIVGRITDIESLTLASGLSYEQAKSLLPRITFD